MKFNKDQHFPTINSEHFRLGIPTLLIVAFILFMCVPDLLNASVHFKLLKGNKQIFYITGIFYRSAWLENDDEVQEQLLNLNYLLHSFCYLYVVSNKR